MRDGKGSERVSGVSERGQLLKLDSAEKPNLPGREFSITAVEKIAVYTPNVAGSGPSGSVTANGVITVNSYSFCPN